MTSVHEIRPCLWYDTQAEEAADFYVSIFKDSRIVRGLRYSEAGHDIHGKPAGSVMTVEFELNGQSFTALNGGPQFKFNEAISFQVDCETQEEVDYYWERLTQDGEEVACGWLKDRYGVSWQIGLTALEEMLADPDRQKVDRVTNAFLHMKKLDLAELKRAYSGERAASP
jgi:predicted 3-demethylubiquinone-9 3-methyltransferase (glyoxalase superfamily)